MRSRHGNIIHVTLLKCHSRQSQFDVKQNSKRKRKKKRSLSNEANSDYIRNSAPILHDNKSNTLSSIKINSLDSLSELGSVTDLHRFNKNRTIFAFIRFLKFCCCLLGLILLMTAIAVVLLLTLMYSKQTTTTVTSTTSTRTTTTTTTSYHCSTLSVTLNWDYYGNDIISNGTAQTFDTCCQWCASVIECTVFVLTAANRCYLKNTTGNGGYFRYNYTSVIRI